MKRIDVINECIICGNKFRTILSRKDRKYCSHKCYSVARANGKYPPYWSGKTRDIETCKKISLKNKGKKIWCTGKKLTMEHRKKLSQAKIGKYIGFKHPNWKGGRKTDERGYIRIWIGIKRWRYEHKLVMEKHLGRKLKTGEVVHHINLDKSDNRIENLILFPNNKAHMTYHKEVLNMKYTNQYS